MYVLVHRLPARRGAPTFEGRCRVMCRFVLRRFLLPVCCFPRSASNAISSIRPARRWWRRSRRWWRRSRRGRSGGGGGGGFHGGVFMAAVATTVAADIMAAVATMVAADITVAGGLMAEEVTAEAAAFVADQRRSLRSGPRFLRRVRSWPQFRFGWKSIIVECSSRNRRWPVAFVRQRGRSRVPRVPVKARNSGGAANSSLSARNSGSSDGALLSFFFVKRRVRSRRRSIQR